MSKLVTINRRMIETNTGEAHKRCSRYHALVKRERWQDDRGNLCRSVYAKGATLYSFTVLNGELIESSWRAVKNTCSKVCDK
jgi:hypothetical protein